MLADSRQLGWRSSSLTNVPPPPYTQGESFGNELLDTNTSTPPYTAAKGLDNGRIEIDFDSKAVRALTRLYNDAPLPQPERITPTEAESTCERDQGLPRLNIVVQVVGSRGDVQPFIALGNELQKHGHRVRIATHDAFGGFVKDHGIEFYPIGGDPVTLMAYMVKNPGLLPSMDSLMAGEIQEKRNMVTEMLEGCWDSCVLPDISTGQPFVADAIIANPPSFAHVHCAEALGIPVHLMFTMPWSGTRAFPHPLANFKNGSGDERFRNRMSYIVVEWMMWSGLGDLINEWRHRIGLEAIAMFEGPELASLLQVPFTYCWSPALIPKPQDWPENIGGSTCTVGVTAALATDSDRTDVSGFFFREMSHYQPAPELLSFLKRGPPPVYIGFGSIVLQNPNQMLSTILDAVEAAGARAVISKGWSNLEVEDRDNVYLIGDCPHEWLFTKVAAVVHHGGAGTTACGLRNGKPTFIIPFFGDQQFWGQMVAAAGAGPLPVPHKILDPNKLVTGIRYCLSQEARSAAEAIAHKMCSENGVKAAVESFHKHLPSQRMRCDILDQPAVWKLKVGKRQLQLSKLAAEGIVAQRPALRQYLQTFQTKPVHIETRRWDPLSGGSSALINTATDLVGCLTGMVTKPIEERKIKTRQLARNKKRFDSNASTNSASIASLHNSSDLAIEPSRPEDGKKAGKVAAASAKSIGMFAPTAVKGIVADIPYALAEGLRTMPRHYNDTVRDHGTVVNFQSGAVVAGKTFAYGFVDGLSGVVTLPYAGAKKEGAVGAAKGFGKGIASLVAKTGAGLLGVVAYPSLGIAKSLRSAVYSETQKQIAKERSKEGEWLYATCGISKVDADKTSEILRG